MPSSRTLITVRKGEKPLLVMDGTGDVTKLWLFDPNQKVFFRYPVENQPTPITAYQRKGKVWIFVSLEPEMGWQPVTSPETVGLLNEMEKATFDHIASLLSL